MALEGVTAYSLQEAAKKILKGELGHAFFPSPPEIRIVCDAVMKPIKDARMRDVETKRIINSMRTDIVQEKTPEAKARVAAMVERVALETEAENRRHKPDEKDMSPDACKARLEALAASNGQSVDWDKIPNAPPPSGFVKAKPGLNGA